MTKLYPQMHNQRDIHIVRNIYYVAVNTRHRQTESLAMHANTPELAVQYTFFALRITSTDEMSVYFLCTQNSGAIAGC